MANGFIMIPLSSSSARYTPSTVSGTTSACAFGMLAKFKLDLDGTGVNQVDHTSEPPPLPEPKFETELTEASRETELLGEVVREVDNSNSSADLTRTIQLSQTWKKTYHLEKEKTTTFSEGLGFKLSYAIGVKASADRAIRDHYSITHEEERRYSEEVTISVDAKQHVFVIFK